MKKNLFVAAAGVGLMMTGLSAFGQVPPVVSPATAEAQAVQAPAPVAKPFPPVNLKNFTAPSPSREDVDAFLKALWGYDENRVWSVAAVLATPAPGVSKVVVFVQDKTQPGKDTQTVFFVTPDGKHAIAGDVIDFGAKPFADTRKTLQEKADGASHGAKGNELELVEFADLQCPHCKEFESTMENLAMDFPQAKIVFENYPITELHPWAFRAAAEGECVRKAKGDDAFFTYVKSTFELQEGLTAERGEATLTSAVTKAGADPAKMAACAATPEIRATIDKQKKLGVDIGVDQTPMLAINGHILPAAQIPYEVLKKIIAYQAGQDGVTVHLQPSLTQLK